MGMGVGCPCPPVRDNIVTPCYLFLSSQVKAVPPNSSVTQDEQPRVPEAENRKRKSESSSSSTSDAVTSSSSPVVKKKVVENREESVVANNANKEASLSTSGNHQIVLFPSPPSRPNNKVTPFLGPSSLAQIDMSKCKSIDIWKRICTYCGIILSLRVSKTSNVSVFSHLNSSACEFLMKNFPPCQNGTEEGQSQQCHLCPKKHIVSKTLNIKILNHMKIMHSDSLVECVFCEDPVSFASFPAHLKLCEANPFFQETGVSCSRCQETFHDSKLFFSHLTQKHEIKSPNLTTINNHIHTNQKFRSLVLLAVFLQKYE